MIRLLADENFNNHILLGLSDRSSDFEIVRVQDVGLSGAGDDVVLAWAAANDCLLLTHDQRTIPAHLQRLARDGEPFPGVIIVLQHVSMRQAIDELVLILSCASPLELSQVIYYLPL